MTTIVSRLYPDHETAKAAFDALVELGCSGEELAIVGEGGHIAKALAAAGVPPQEQQAYAPHIVEGRALVVAQARFGAAFTVAAAMDEFPAIQVQGMKDGLAHLELEDTLAGSILSGYRLFFTNPNDRLTGGLVFGGDPIIRRAPSGSIMTGVRFISRYFWPMKLISTYKPKTSAIRGGFLFSSLLGLPTLTRRRT